MIGEMLKTTLAALRSAFCSRAALLAENVVLRQQIVVLQHSVEKGQADYDAKKATEK